MPIASRITNIRKTLPKGVNMVCVSKFHPADAIMQAYNAKERDFGESRVQELLCKYEILPKDIRWHFIGHLQTNKVKQIVPFVYMIHSVDSLRLMEIINREAERIQRRIKVLLEVHVAREETKTGFTPQELLLLNSQLLNFKNIEICGIMGMATNTENQEEWRRCFREIHNLAYQLSLNYVSPIISMGMSDDYLVAIEEGSNMVRIGSTIFGERQY